MEINSVELTAEEFLPYGKIMAGADVAGFTVPEASEEYTWNQTSEDVQMDPVCCSGMLVCKSREMKVQKMEHHAHTSEVLVAVKNDYILCVAPANAGNPEMDKVKAFRVKQGTVLVMNRACWHWIPFPQNEENAEVLVFFRGKTGDDDLIFAELPEIIEIDR